MRIGVAVCDTLEIAAFPVGTLKRTGSLKRDVASVADLAAEQEAEAVLVGLPLSLDGEVGPQAQQVQGFARALGRATTAPIALWDESLSSVEANAKMIARGLSRAKRRAQIDQQAAVEILNSFLQHRRDTNAPRDTLLRTPS